MVGDPFAHCQAHTGDLGPVHPHTRSSLFQFRNQAVASQHIGNRMQQSLHKSVQIFVADLQGSYSGVMGLPLMETAELLHNANMKLLG